MTTRTSKMYRAAAITLLMAGLPSSNAQMGGQPGDAGQTPVAMGNARMVRGTITAAATDKLTVKTEQGDVYTVALSANTQVRKGRDQIKVADVHVGDGVGAMGEIDQPAKTVHALFVAVVSAEDLKKAREAMGKTFISGTVTSINDLKLTIKRTDDVVQVIEVDEDTSFRRGARGMQMALGADGLGGGGGASFGGRWGGQPAGAGAQAAPEGGESLTLADVRVGSVVAGPGAIKNGVFVAKTLGVSEAGGQRQRRRPEGAQGTSNAGPPAATANPAAPPVEQK